MACLVRRPRILRLEGSWSLITMIFFLVFGCYNYSFIIKIEQNLTQSSSVHHLNAKANKIHHTKHIIIQNISSYTTTHVKINSSSVPQADIIQKIGLAFFFFFFSPRSSCLHTSYIFMWIYHLEVSSGMSPFVIY